MNKKSKTALSDASLWIRLCYTLFFGFVIYIVLCIFLVIVVLQLLFSFITGSEHKKIIDFSDVLHQYLSQCLRFVAFLSDAKPFPFDDFPQRSVQSVSTSSEIDPFAVDDNQTSSSDEESVNNNSSEMT